MNRIRQQRQRALRQWLGLCLVLLLAVAPPFNLAGFDLSLPAPADAGVHAGHGHQGHDHANLAHHTSSNACLQCLVMGGMSLAGAAAMPELTPHDHGLATGWVLTSFVSDSRKAGTIGCRGPPARA